MIASTDITAVYQQLKTGALEKYFSGMNKEQKKAVFQNKGPLLILAGAGSGKTTVVVNRIANLTLFGDAYHSEKLPEDITADDITILQNYIDGQPVEAEMQRVLGSTAVRPWNILAITFTNKAAGELKERLQKVLGETGKDVAAGTFHWTCINILRGRVRGAEKSNLELLGYGKTFTIYDTDDSLRVIKEGVKQAGENDKNFPPRSILSAIGKAKDKFLTPKEYQQAAGDDFRLQVIGKVYEYYQKHLKAANAMDFDDIILQTVLLLENNPEVLEYYQNRYRYIMVDEYQDTNNCQYRLISLLSKAHQNLCVVGDDDQSIYKFRGATIENIMSFEKQFPNTTVVKLEQNYRCTQNILDAANGVISHNTQRKGKELWTENELGEKIHVFRGNDETEEGRFIADTILTNVQNGQKYSDHAILYRMNSQSNTIESCLVRSGIAYKIIGGVRFYERKEIKDIMAYLSIISNSADRIRLRRIINEPKRGIGEATLTKAEEISETLGVSLFDVLRDAESYQPLAKKSAAIISFTDMIEELMALEQTVTMGELMDELLEKTGYMAMLKAMGDEGITRIENVEELKSNIIKYEEEYEEPNLAGFLEQAALYTDLDSLDENADYVVMMTMHAAKGLEFPNVFLCGAEEGIFPGVQSMYNPEQVEEERRLAYVCLTRAKKQLYITIAAQRMLFGHTSRNKISRFVDEIPKTLCEIDDKTLTRVHQPIQKHQPDKNQNRSANNIGVGSTVVTKQGFDLAVGDKVTHKVFGQGVIANITKMGADHLVEIELDNGTTKKVMATFARLQKM